MKKSTAKKRERSPEVNMEEKVNAVQSLKKERKLDVTASPTSPENRVTAAQFFKPASIKEAKAIDEHAVTVYLHAISTSEY